MGYPRKVLQVPACYHLTHRCHERQFLLKFKRDRRNYLERLRQAHLRFPVAVLSYMVTCNHIHLLVWAETARVVSATMHFLEGATGGDFNRRKEREGAFWSGRYHPTLIENGDHLSRCLLYIDLNPVRAGACKHPAEWIGSAFDELCNPKQRYRIIDRSRLLRCLAMPEELFRRWYPATVESKIMDGYLAREAFWSRSLAVGCESWVRARVGGVENVQIENVRPEVREERPTYAATASKRAEGAFWRDRTA